MKEKYKHASLESKGGVRTGFVKPLQPSSCNEELHSRAF